jgi:glycosyltransferase involved in cell wall biosynthesis
MTRPIAYVMEQTLGNVTHYLNLRREEDAAGPDLPRWLPIDYRPGRLPWTVRGGLLARKAIAAAAGEVSGIFVHTLTLALLSSDLFGRIPAVLSSDGTPLNKSGMRASYGLAPEGLLAREAKRALYRRMLRRARGLVAWSSDARRSFVEDYGCPGEDVAVIAPGVDLRRFKPGPRRDGVPRILFVGGDFARKGGEALLNVFRRRLRGRAVLVLVTGAALADEPGVEVHRGVRPNSDELLRLYSTSDLFALPTRGDCFPLACLEALASGLPMIASRVGGIPDAVREGETGHLVAPGDDDALGDALESLVADPVRRASMAAASRREAESRFDARANARRLFEYVRARTGR